MTKTYIPLHRPQIAGEAEIREMVEESLREHTIYGHRVMTRARRTMVARILDDVYLRQEAERAAEFAA